MNELSRNACQLANEMGITVEHGIIRHRKEVIEAFYRVAFNAGIEAAASRIESDTHNYAKVIRNLEMK